MSSASDAAFPPSSFRPSEELQIERLEAMRPMPRISIQAFCQTGETAAALEATARDRRMVKTQLRVQQGGIRAATELYGSAPTPNLIFIESLSGAAELLADLEALADVCDPGSKLVIIGHANDVSLYRELTRRGVSEYMLAPVDLADVVAVVGQLFVAPDAKPLGRTTAFVGTKGGTGASTVAHNVAWTVAQLFGSEVLIIDLDLPFGTANINFDKDPSQGVAEAVFSADRLDDVFLDRLLARCADHLSLLAAPSLLDRPYDFDPEAFSATIEAAQRGTPHVVLDVPHGWNSWMQNVLQRADDIVLVANPDLANLRNAKNLVDALKRLRPNDAAPRLVLNATGMAKRPEIASAEFVEPLGVELAAVIGFEPNAFGTAANTGRMIGETDAKHPSLAAFQDLAHALTGRARAKAPRRSPASGLLRLIGRG